MQRHRRLRRPNLKNARASLGITLAASALLAALVSGNAQAVPVSSPPPFSRAPGPIASSPPNLLPIDSSLLFVLDDPISSLTSKKDQIARAHLKSPLVVDGRTIAPAGTPARIKILDAQAAQAGDVYGYVDIYFLPLRLPDGRQLPLRAPTAHLNVNVTAGHESTVGVEDTVGDIFIPFHVLYHAFRKGRNFVLGPGSEIRARTEAAIRVGPHGAIAVTTPVPLVIGGGTPHPSFNAMPFATPGEKFMPHTPKPKPTPSPATTPTPEQSPQ